MYWSIITFSTVVSLCLATALDPTFARHVALWCTPGQHAAFTQQLTPKLASDSNEQRCKGPVLGCC
jgi:hypothetical protein